MNPKIIEIPVIPLIPNQDPKPGKMTEPLFLLIILLLLWFFIPHWLNGIDETDGVINQNIVLLIILSFICFLLVSVLCWWLCQTFWRTMGLPAFKSMVSKFYTLTLCQQFIFYYASFALLLLSALACLSAIC